MPPKKKTKKTLKAFPKPPQSPRKSRKVLILTPRHWFVEECCVQAYPSATPSAPLMLAALLRQHGHLPQVLSYLPEEDLRLSFKPDVVVFYSPFNMFIEMTAPIINALRAYATEASLILIMYDSLSDSETQAMLCCPALDYAVLPHEKELSVLDLVEHGSRRCPGGFDSGTGVLYRDQNGLVATSGQRKALPNLDHLPYLGDELAIYWRENDHSQFNAASITYQRGCPNPCTFCPMRGTRPRYRDPELVAREMQVATEITGKPYMLCLEVLHEPEQVDALCNLLLSRNIHLADGLGARCELVNDQGLLEKLARVGLSYLYFGVEAATEQMRSRLKKPIPDESLQQAIKLSRQAGLGFTCSFLTGLPWEDEAYYHDFSRLIVDLASKQHCRRINMARLQPWPGLPITRDLVAQGVIERGFTFQEWNLSYPAMFNKFRHTIHLGQRELEEVTHILNTLADKMTGRHSAIN